MTHQPYLDLLAVRDDLTAEEEAALAAHLDSCAECVRTAEVYAWQDPLLRESVWTRAPEGLERMVLDRTRRTSRRPVYRAAWISGLAAAALVCVVILALLPALNPHNATPANAYALLRRAVQASPARFPYTGSSAVSYVSLPIYDLPAAAAAHVGFHRAVVHWSVRDQSHYRVVIHTLQPALDAGTTTIVVNGPRVLAYDTRTETAGLGGILPVLWKRFAAYLLPSLQSGLTYGGPQPDPAQSIQSYLAQLRGARSAVGGYARLAGQTHLLGRLADVVDFAPAVIDCTRSVQRRGQEPRCVAGHGKGWARVWIDHSRPFVLRYEEHGLTDVHDLDTQRLAFRYRVTSLHFGQGPSNAALHYRPPVRVAYTGTKWSIFENGSGTGGGIRPPFLTPGSPAEFATGFRVWVPDQQAWGSFVSQGPTQRPVELYSLYDSGHHVTTYVTGAHGVRHPFGLYATGPYVLIVQRIRVHGLPVALHAGTARQAGACTIWTGAYADGQHWAAFAVKQVSILVVTDSLDARQLRRYVAQDFCSAHG